MILSRNAKEAVKTALAMTVTYAIALGMGWEKPLWAGFAVAFCSLSTVGQSLNKSALRMLGTLVAGVVSLTIIALFAQDRWFFLLSLSAWAGFCTYMSGGTRHQYFWNVCGFVGIIICMSAGTSSADTFGIAILRAQETGLGILVYSLFSLFLWPTGSGADFKTTAANLVSIQHQLYQANLGLMRGNGDVQEAQSLSAQADQVKTRFDQLLDAAETDSYDVWELRRQWRLFQHLAAELTETMRRWRESFTEVQRLDLHRLLPNLELFGDELEMRFAQIERMLGDQAPEQQPTAMEPSLDKSEMRTLSHFNRAALAVNRDQLQHLESLTRALFACVSDIMGFEASVVPTDSDSQAHPMLVIDPDRMANAVRLMTIFWLACLSWIWVPYIPGGTGFVTFSGSLGMALVNMPQIRVTLLMVPAALSILFAGLVYIFIMPQLSGFLDLGILIFAVTFLICFLFAAPMQALGKALGLAMFLAISSISNQQQIYSFLTVANIALMFALVLMVLAITVYFPMDLRPERVFERLLSRFFRSCAFLMAHGRRGLNQRPSRFFLWKNSFHIQEMATLPRKILPWVRVMPAEDMGPEGQTQVQSLAEKMQALSYRMQDLLKARTAPQSEALVRELHGDVEAWVGRVRQTFRSLSSDPGARGLEGLQEKLAQTLKLFEAHIEEALDRAQDATFSPEDGENFYRLLGAYRGVSEALVDYDANAARIDWGRLQEERF